MFVLHDVSAQTFNDEERALQLALRPLIDNGDCHFAAAVTSLVQSLLEGRTDCPISLWCWKNLVCGGDDCRLACDGSHPQNYDCDKRKCGCSCLCETLPASGTGAAERPCNKTDLDVPPAFRNDVLRSKQALIGCGGGFHQECSQPYSPVANWVEDADVTLNDEEQQMAIWMRRPQLRALPTSALLSGVVITNKPLVGCERLMRPRLFGENHCVD